MDYAIAIDRLRPGAKWKRSEDYADLVETWGEDDDPPTDAELIAAFLEWNKEQEKAAQVPGIRSALFAIFAAQPKEVRAAFYADKVDITAAFKDGDIEAALEMLNNLSTETQDQADAKAEMLALVAPLQGA